MTPSIVNVTLPDGLPAVPLGETMAVKVTGWPTVDGLSDDVNVVVVVVPADRRDDRLRGQRPLLATHVCIAAVRRRDRVRAGRERRGGELGLVAAAARPEGVTGDCAWPSMVKVTVPVGVPGVRGAVTVAVKVTGLAGR